MTGGEGRAAALFFIPGVIFFGCVFVYPAFATVRMSLSDVDATTIVQGGWSFIGLDNFTALIGMAAARRTLLNSGIFLLACIIPQVCLGLLFAVALKKRTRARKIARSVLLLPWLLPSVAVSAIFLWIFDSRAGLANWALQSLGLIDEPILWFTGPQAMLVIILVNIWIGIPFNFLILQSGLQALPDEVHEAAAVDGAGWWRELFSVTIPMLKESIFAVIMLGFIGTLKVFDFVWIMTRGGPANATMLPGPLAYDQAFQSFNYGRGAAIIMVTVVLMALLALIYLQVTRTGTEQATNSGGRRG